MELMSLREMCRTVGVSRRSIQCYEKAGLMMPTDKNKYGHLLYDQNALNRAEKIRFLQQMGFKLREIKGLIDEPVIKEALEGRMAELKAESDRLKRIIAEAEKYIEKLK